jgi:hypothetical protein
MLVSSTVMGALLVACGGSVEEANLDEGVNVNAGVELKGVAHMYSGRPDPTWTLRYDEVREIRKRIQGLSPTTAPEDFPKLGELYLEVVNNHKAHTLPDRIEVGRGVVQITAGTTSSYFKDEKELGELLEASARAAGAFER